MSENIVYYLVLISRTDGNMQVKLESTVTNTFEDAINASRQYLQKLIETKTFANEITSKCIKDPKKIEVLSTDKLIKTLEKENLCWCAVLRHKEEVNLNDMLQIEISKVQHNSWIKLKNL